jgi:hypothetical protein
MPPDSIDRPLVRLAIGLLVGLPLSVVALFAIPHGLMLGYAGLAEADALNLFAGLCTLLGTVAILGAWYRLIVPRAEMSSPAVRVVRASLFAGLVSSLGLAVWAAAASWFTLAIAMLLLVAVGAVLMKHTPAHNAL